LDVDVQLDFNWGIQAGRSSLSLQLVGNWILVVEDDADTREVLVEALHESGFAALGTSCVVEAFNAIVEKSPALVLSDINLGDSNAGELLDMAMKILGPAAPPFVFVTGMPAWHLTGAATSVPVLRKPVKVDALLDVVAKYCLRTPNAPPLA
jgi:two-component system CheB/CheR fusion protein